MEQYDVVVKQMVDNEPLPASGYVAIIKDAKEQEYSWGKQLVVSFDIAEGEYKDFFADQYKANTQEDKKWKGNYRITLPKEGDQYEGMNKKILGNFIWSVENSNSGFKFKFDESTLKGKKIGVVFRNKEWAFDGKMGWTTECGKVIDADSIRTGNYSPMKDKPLPDNKKAKVEEIQEAEIDDGDLPF